MKIWKIVITGGPCAGKSTAMSWIQNAFTERGFKVLFIPETATELISGGVAPWTCGTNEDYQKCQVRLQLEKERIFEMAARTMKAEKILIVCDRGALDNKAYMNDEEFAHVLEYFGTDEVTLRDSYDAVFHLVTAAKGAAQFYTTANNTARYETAEEARRVDDVLIGCWTGHPHLRVIDNSMDFEEKMLKLIAEITAVVGEPEPKDIERKFLIDMPDLAWLEAHPQCKRLEITQTYLLAPEGVEVRVRRRGENGHYIYYKTVKRLADRMKIIESEERLTKDEYRDLLLEADPRMRTLEKTRYCLSYAGQPLEIDVYPFWEKQAVLQVKVSHPAEDVRIPEEIRVQREITGEKAFKNVVLASKNDDEI
ncbi:MAG: AAA family ATPase [Lachnospiraceae bacterium]|nr:AAA family ATPase [Lachnospiraceae bacterium]